MAMTPKTPKTKRTLGRNPRTDGRSRRAFELARERKASGRLTTDDINRALKTLGRKGALKAGVGAGVGAAGLIKRMLGAGMSPDQLKKRIAGLKDKLGKEKCQKDYNLVLVQKDQRELFQVDQLDFLKKVQ